MLHEFDKEISLFVINGSYSNTLQKYWGGGID